MHEPDSEGDASLSAMFKFARNHTLHGEGCEGGRRGGANLEGAMGGLARADQTSKERLRS